MERQLFTGLLVTQNLKLREGMVLLQRYSLLVSPNGLHRRFFNLIEGPLVLLVGELGQVCLHVPARIFQASRGQEEV